MRSSWIFVDHRSAEQNGWLFVRVGDLGERACDDIFQALDFILMFVNSCLGVGRLLRIELVSQTEIFALTVQVGENRAGNSRYLKQQP